MEDFQRIKAVVRDYQATFDAANEHNLGDALSRHTTAERYRWRGMHPFYEQRRA